MSKGSHICRIDVGKEVNLEVFSLVCYLLEILIL